MNSTCVPSYSLATAHSAKISSSSAERDGTGLPSPSTCDAVHDDEKPMAPPVNASRNNCCICATWAGVARSCDRGISHHHAAHRRVPGHERHVERGASAIDGIEVLARRVPSPRHAGAQRLERHAFDARQHAHDVVAVGVGERRDGEPAVAPDHGRDAVQRRRREPRVPEDLRVEMRVDVDEPRCDDQTVGVDGLARGFAERARRGNAHDAAVAHADVGVPAGRARAIDDESTGNCEIEHCSPFDV